MSNRHFTCVAILLCLALSACGDLPDWLSSAPPVVKRAPGERIDVVGPARGLTPDLGAQEVSVTVPEQANLDHWHSLNQAMQVPHIGLTGIRREQSARIGDGYGFTRPVVSPPVIGDGLVFAMDASGAISAHRESAISDIAWVDLPASSSASRDVLGGGLTLAGTTLYAATGDGILRALEAKTGKQQWSIRVGAPVRGAPAADGNTVVVLTADNQTLAYDATSGQPRWEHRGIRESAGYFSLTSPVISDEVVVVAYSSGELFALRLESGSVIWSDTLTGGTRTQASAVLKGIDAVPVVQEGVVVAATTSGQIQASLLANGRPLWQQPIGTQSAPWSAGNVLFMLSPSHDIAALLKRDGSVRWATSLAVRHKRDPAKDKTPPLYGPILSGNAVLVVDGDGVLRSFNPETGAAIDRYELADGIVTAPVIANGAMYVITKAGKLYKYY